MSATNHEVQTREEKHIALHHAIQGLDRITGKLDELISRIEESYISEPVCAPTVAEPPPSLINILNSGADVIREKTDSAVMRISKLNEQLF